MSPAPAPEGPRGAASPPWGILAVGIALGLVVGLFVADRFIPRPVPAPAPMPVPAAAVDAGLTPEQAERLIAALESFDAAARRLGDAVDRTGRAAPGPAAPSATPTAAPPSPRADPPGSLVPGLPPEGVPLVKVWYGRRLRAELAELELVAANPSATLGNAASPEALAAAQAGWKADGERLLAALESLAAVTSELQLARWLDTTGRGATFPKPWQLRELAAELRESPK